MQPASFEPNETESSKTPMPTAPSAPTATPEPKATPTEVPLIPQEQLAEYLKTDEAKQSIDEFVCTMKMAGIKICVEDLKRVDYPRNLNLQTAGQKTLWKTST